MGMWHPLSLTPLLHLMYEQPFSVQRQHIASPVQLTNVVVAVVIVTKVVLPLVSGSNVAILVSGACLLSSLGTRR